MFGSTRSGANAYATVGIETGVSSASPHKLIVMLYDGALVAVATASQLMKAGDIPGKAKAISKAITIVESGLRASLNKEVGGEIAQNLDALYEYISNRLLLANLNNDLELLDEVSGLLRDLKSAWEAIGPTAAAQPTPVTQSGEAKTGIYENPAPQNTRLVKA